MSDFIQCRLRCEALAEFDARHPVAAGGGEQVGELLGGLGDRETFGADVRDAVTLRVNHARRRLPANIDAERIRGAEAGALTDKNRRDARAEDPANLVADRDTGTLDDRDWADAQ